MSQNLNQPISKSRKSEANLSQKMSAVEEANLNHPRKVHSPISTTPVIQEEGKDPHTGATQSTSTKSPKGPKVQDRDEIEAAISKGKFLPLCDSKCGADLWFQPRYVDEVGKSVSTVTFEVLACGSKLYSSLLKMSIYNTDLLRMLYLANQFENDYFTLNRADFNDWLIEKYTDLLKERRSLEMTDHGAIAHFLLQTHGRDMFKIGKGTYHEVFFRKACKRIFEGYELEYINPNVVECVAARGNFEYVIEARVFALSEEIHPQKLSEVLEIEESQRL